MEIGFSTVGRIRASECQKFRNYKGDSADSEAGAEGQGHPGTADRGSHYRACRQEQGPCSSGWLPLKMTLQLVEQVATVGQ